MASMAILLVPVVGDGEDDGVHVLPRQDFAIVARGEELAAPDFLGASEAAFVDVADRDQFDAAGGQGAARVAAAANAVSDESDANAVVGRDALRRLGHDFSGHTRRERRGGQEMTPGGCHAENLDLYCTAIARRIQIHSRRYARNRTKRDPIEGDPAGCMVAVGGGAGSGVAALVLGACRG